jgi:hypothetical protein
MFAARLFCFSFLLQACGPEHGAFGHAEKPPQPTRVHSTPARASNGVEAHWPEASFSPALTAPPAPAQPGDPGSELHAAFQTPCGAADRALEEAAASFARALSQGKPTPEPDEIALWLRQQGSPYVWPRAWALESTDEQLASGRDRLTSWLGSFDDGGVRRCGVGSARSNGRTVLAVVATDVLADLDPLPVRARVGNWLALEARLLVPANEAKVVLLGPSGAPRPVPTSLVGQRVTSRFALERSGRFLIQVLADVAGGPRPVLEALVFADIEPPAALAPGGAPGEEAGAELADPAQAIERMLAITRQKERLPSLARVPALDQVALEHAEAMRDAGRIGHDVGRGNPAARVAAAGLAVRGAGENVAHALSAIHAHRSLHASPSHRANMLSPAFDSVGIGVAADRDGTLWVCQLYARVAR